MSAPLFTRTISLAGQGSVARSFTRTKCHGSDTSTTGSHRPNRLELQAVLAHAQARKGSESQTNTNDASIVGLGLPSELFPPSLRDTPPRMAPMGVRSTSYAQTLFSAPPTPPPTPPASPEMQQGKAWPIDYDEGDLSLPSTPVNMPSQPTLRKPLERPLLYVMPPFAHEQPQSQSLIGLGIMIPVGSFVGSPVEPTASAFLGPRIDPRRIIEDSAADPIVTPGELMRRNFPLTPGAPIHSAARVAPGESTERYFPLTPGLPLHLAVTPAQEAGPRDFHRTPGAPLYRQTTIPPVTSLDVPQRQGTVAFQSLFEGLLGNWGSSNPASRCSSFGGLSVTEDQMSGPTPLPTPAGIADMYFV